MVFRLSYMDLKAAASGLPQRAPLSASTSRRTRSAVWDTKAPASFSEAGAVRPSSRWSGRTVQIGFVMRFFEGLRSFCGLESRAVTAASASAQFGP